MLAAWPELEWLFHLEPRRRLDGEATEQGLGVWVASTLSLVTCVFGKGSDGADETRVALIAVPELPPAPAVAMKLLR